MSKTLERLVARQLHKYLSRNHLLAKFQSAYRENHSTETAMYIEGSYRHYECFEHEKGCDINYVRFVCCF